MVRQSLASDFCLLKMILPDSNMFDVHLLAFVTTKGKKQQLLFACDYGQKEVRILAHMCGDEALRSLFRDDNNIDIYKQMASLIRNKPIETIGTDERAQFKQVTLAILYGMSPRQVAKKLNISEDAAKRTMNDFFHKFSTLKRVCICLNIVDLSACNITGFVSSHIINTLIFPVDGRDEEICTGTSLRTLLNVTYFDFPVEYICTHDMVLV